MPPSERDVFAGFVGEDITSEAGDSDATTDFGEPHPDHGEKEGETFNAHAIMPEYMTDGHSSAKLPESIYSAGLVVLLIYEPNCSNILKNYLPVYWSLLLTIAIQLWTTLMIRGLVTSDTDFNGSDCSSGDPFLRAICTVVYVVMLLNEMKESFYIYVWASRLETLKCGEPWEKFKMKSYKKIDVEGVEHSHCKVTSRMPPYVKFLTYIVIIIPKTIITLGLLSYGTGYVLRSKGNEALILNSVALTFITQVDDAFYQFTLLDRVKDWLSDMPQSSLHPDERERWHGKILFHVEDFWALYMNLFLILGWAHSYHTWC